jgi:hypothetical protein
MTRHLVRPSAGRMTGFGGASSTPRYFESITNASDYWITRLRG